MLKLFTKRDKASLFGGISKGLFYVVGVVASVFVMINVHEIGHTILARLFGDASATYYLFRLHTNGSLACIGCNTYDEAALSWIGKVVVTLGGIIFSQGLAIMVLWYGKRERARKCWRFCKILVIACGFDVVFQVLQGVLANTTSQTGLTQVDMGDFIWLVSGRTGISDVLVKISTVAVLLMYLWWLVSAYRADTACGSTRSGIKC